jgi:enoyl-CoA hydratase/carnithine racemase
MSENFWSKTFKDVLVENKQGHLWIRLNRPDKRNAYSTDMVESLQAIFKMAHRDEKVKIIYLTGQGEGFCAGGDLDSMKSKSGMFAGNAKALRDHYRHGLQELSKIIWNCDKVIIAVVNGPAAGAGCDLACMCDLRITADSAFYIEPFARVGLVPGDGGSFFLPLIVGHARAMHMLLTGEKIKASQALDWGLTNKICEKENLETEASNWGAKILSQGHLALSLTKKAVKDMITRPLDSHLELLAAYQAIAQRDDEHQVLLDKLLQ